MTLKALALTGAGSSLAGGTAVRLPDLGAEINALRPRSFVRVIATYQVKPDGTKDYTTIQAALTAAAAAQSAKLAAEGGGVLLTPNHTVEIVIHPGTYTQTAQLVPNPYVNLISATGVPGDVVIRSLDLNAAALGTFSTNSSFYWEGLDIVRAGPTAANSGKYCHHIALTDFQTGVSVRCRYYTETIHSSGGWTDVGMDGAPGIGLLYHECSFFQKSSGTYAPGGTNLHGLIAGAPSGSATSDIIFRRTVAGAVGYNALTNLVPDDVWVDGGTYSSVAAEGTLTDLHHAGDTTGLLTSQGSIIASITGIPVIAAGMTARERLHFYGTPVA